MLYKINKFLVLEKKYIGLNNLTQILHGREPKKIHHFLILTNQCSILIMAFLKAPWLLNLQLFV